MMNIYSSAFLMQNACNIRIYSPQTEQICLVFWCTPLELWGCTCTPLELWGCTCTPLPRALFGYANIWWSNLDRFQ